MQNTRSNPGPALELGMLIGGEHVTRGARIEVRNPAHPSEVVGTIIRATPEDVDQAVAAAKAAQPAWAAKSFVEPAAILSSMLDRVEDHLQERAILFVRENGKPLVDAIAELKVIVPQARPTLELAQELDDGVDMPAPNGRTHVRYVPYGVVVGIVPWNSPVTLAALQVIPALMAGNTFVLKVPETCPFALSATAEIMAQVLPPGVLNVISGLPGDIGDTLTSASRRGQDRLHRQRALRAQDQIANAAQTIKGHDRRTGRRKRPPPSSWTTWSCHRRGTGRAHGGHRLPHGRPDLHGDQAHLCRLETRSTSAFVEAFCKAADRIVVGDGLVPAVAMGPVHTRASQERGLELVADAERRGARVRRLGQIDDPATFKEGYFMRPTVVTDVDDEAPLMTEEQFCPAIPIARQLPSDVDEALSARQRQHLRPGRWIGQVEQRHRQGHGHRPAASGRHGVRQHPRHAQRQPARRPMAWPQVERHRSALGRRRVCANTCKARP